MSRKSPLDLRAQVRDIPTRRAADSWPRIKFSGRRIALRSTWSMPAAGTMATTATRGRNTSASSPACCEPNRPTAAITITITITSSIISIAMVVFISFSSLSLLSTGTARGSPRRTPASASLVMTRVRQPAGGKPRPAGPSTRAASTITSWLRVRRRPKHFRNLKAPQGSKADSVCWSSGGGTAGVLQGVPRWPGDQPELGLL